MTSPTAPSADRAPPRLDVLLVEDSDSDALLTAEQLRGSLAPAIRVRRAGRLTELADLLTDDEAPVDCVLLDLSLPDSHGLGTVSRARELAGDIPIVVLTALADLDAGLAALHAGAADYLVKDDVSAELLQRAVRGSVERARSTAALAAAQRRLQASEALLRGILSNASVAIYAVDGDGRFTLANEAAAETFGLPPERLIGRRWAELVPAEFAEQQSADDNRVLESAEPETFSEAIPDRSGALRSYVWVKYPLLDEAGLVSGVAGIATDVTELRQVQRALAAVEQRWQRVFLASPTGMAMLTDELTIVASNPAWSVLTGRSADELAGLRYDLLVHEEDRTAVRAAFAGLTSDDQAVVVEHRLRRAGGSNVWLRATLTAIDSADERRVLIQAEDVTARKAVTDRLSYLALHDPLTGLHNRAAFADRLDQARARAHRRGGPLSLLMLDLDGFKQVNDTLGHTAGDALLIEASRRLLEVLRPADTVARFGGDEFAVLLDQVDDRHEVEVVASRVLDALRVPINVADTSVTVTASVGIACVDPRLGTDEVVRQADRAMYEAKRRGKNRWQRYDDALYEQLEGWQAAEERLKDALRHRLVRVALQPVVDVGAVSQVGAEALARILTPEGDVLQPEEFIPVAESSGSITEIGATVLELATEGAAGALAAINPESWFVSVNVSAKQAGRHDLAERVLGVLAHKGLEPRRLALELTETVLFEAARSTLNQLDRLVEAGVRIGIDDFGIGYASLRYLAELPVQFVKVDRSFVAGLPSDPKSRAIVDAVAHLAADLGLVCIAEGVETEAQHAALTQYPGMLAQGFFYGRPQLPG